MAVENPQDHAGVSKIPARIWDIPGCSYRDLDVKLRGIDEKKVIEQSSQGQEIGECAICKGCSNSVRNIGEGLDALQKEVFSWIEHGGYWNTDYTCIAAREDEDFSISSLPIISETNGVENCSRFSPTTAERVRVITATLKGLVRVETGEAKKVTLSKPIRKEIVYPDFGGYSIAVSQDILRSERHLVLGGRIRIGLPSKTEVA